MPARAMWKADLELGDTKVAVKLYAAVKDAKVHFRLLHAKDHAPVEQRLVAAETDEVVPKEDVRRAVAVERGIYVVLTPEEQQALKPKPSRSIAVEQFVPLAALDERWFDRPYYLGPDGDDGQYFALAAVLAERKVCGIAQWVLRNKRYVGAVHSSGGYLLLDTLRYADEVLELGAVRPPAGRAVDKREIALAQQLIGALEDRFDAEAFRDEYRDSLRKLLSDKAAGKVVHFPRAPKRTRSDSLVASLQASLASRRKEIKHGRRA